tara:strand:+ start:350 stop:520 length:171 start_codon:yes stop_codon:yes gene_type:complete
MWDVYEAANYIGCAAGTLRNWASQRRVPFRKVGSLLRFSKQDLDRWLERCAVHPQK